MIVGNIATLRPLFRILRDGKTSDYNKSPLYNNSRRTGGGMYSKSYELAENGKSANHTAITSVVERERNGSLSDGDSQKEILDNVQRPGQTEIFVNRQVTVAYD